MKTSAKSKVLSVRLRPEECRRLRCLARRLGKTPGETGAVLLEEGLRRGEFPFIDFRDSTLGRQAFVLGTRIPIWQLLLIHRELGERVEKTAAYFGWDALRVQAGLNYARAFSAEIEALIADAETLSFDDFERTLPGIERLKAGAL